VSNGRDNDRAQDSGHRAVGPVLGSDLQVVGPVRDDGHQADVWRNDPRDVDAAAGPPSQASVAAEPQACKGHADVRALAGAGAAVVWSKDKDLAGCAAVAGDTDPCREVRRTIAPAIFLGAGAAAAVVVGTVVLIGGRTGDATLAVSVQPSGVGLGGRF